MQPGGAFDQSAPPAQIDALCDRIDPRWTWSTWGGTPDTACKVFAPLYLSRYDLENHKWQGDSLNEPHTVTLCLWGGRPAFCFRGKVDNDLHIGIAGYGQVDWFIPTADRAAVDPTVIDLPSLPDN